MLRMPGEAAATIDLTSLPAEVAALIERLQQQAKVDAQELARRGREIAWAHLKIDKLNFEVARLRRWKFDAKTEAMTAEQRALFQDTMAEDEASLQAQLAELQRDLPEAPKTPKAPPRSIPRSWPKTKPTWVRWPASPAPMSRPRNSRRPSRFSPRCRN